MPLAFIELFAGGGMARLAIDDAMTCTFANDFCPKKAACYRANFGADELRVADIATLTFADLPGRPNLVWASPPCVDVSLAGHGGGLAAPRSGVFWPFARLMGGLVAQGRAPDVIAVENVVELARDLPAIVEAFVGMGYAVGAVEIDAALFVPQSRRRLFIVAVHADADLPQQVAQDGPSLPFHTPAIMAAHSRLTAGLQHAWRWWRLPIPPPRQMTLGDVLQRDVRGKPADLARILELMTPLHRAKVDAAMRSRRPGEIMVGAVNRRMRGGRQVAEVRFDGLAHALRTGKGGSSTQTFLIADDLGMHARRITPREAARLMGLPDGYRLPKGVTAAHDLVGDGVAIPVVSWLFRHVLAPILEFCADPGAEGPATKSASTERV